MPQTKIFHIRKTADKDLENIFIYSVEKFGIKRAEKYNYLVFAFQTLANDYNLGRDCSHVRPNLYAWNVVSHVIYYKPTKGGISIYRVLHKSMDYIKHLS
jgi:toxin ParE1/3/4